MVPGYLVGLRTLLTFNDVEFDFVAFFQTFVPIDLDGAVVHKDVRTLIASDKSITLCVVKPLDLACVLSHEPCPSLKADSVGGRTTNLPVVETQIGVVWFSFFFWGEWAMVRRARSTFSDSV